MNPNGVRKSEQFKLIMECRSSGLFDFPMVSDGSIPAASPPMSNPAVIVPPAQPAQSGESGVGKGGGKAVDYVSLSENLGKK
ncbi:MAG: hypothetical protein HDQ96_05445 [Lachnospiraceae bacterium]|nr:hypothetical protein [Lachnospiraceae bacterium]